MTAFEHHAPPELARDVCRTELPDGLQQIRAGCSTILLLIEASLPYLADYPTSYSLAMAARPVPYWTLCNIARRVSREASRRKKPWPRGRPQPGQSPRLGAMEILAGLLRNTQQ